MIFALPEIGRWTASGGLVNYIFLKNNSIWPEVYSGGDNAFRVRAVVVFARAVLETIRSY